VDEGGASQRGQDVENAFRTESIFSGAGLQDDASRKEFSRFDLHLRGDGEGPHGDILNGTRKIRHAGRTKPTQVAWGVASPLEQGLLE